MPHKCTRCSKVYEDNSPELMEGCSCGSRVFLFLREDVNGSGKDTLEKIMEGELCKESLKWLDQEVEKSGKPIRLDVENLLKVDEGKYRLDISSLMKGDPLVVKVRDGVYYIDLVYSMKKKC